MTYTTFLSCFISLLVNSQMTSRKERLGGGVLMSWCSSTWTLNTIPSLKHKKRRSNCMYHCPPCHYTPNATLQTTLSLLPHWIGGLASLSFSLSVSLSLSVSFLPLCFWLTCAWLPQLHDSWPDPTQRTERTAGIIPTKTINNLLHMWKADIL